LEARRRCLAQAHGKLHRQAQLVVEIRDNEGDTTEAEKLLSNLMMIIETLGGINIE
jgi:type II secretory pathway predicted ATPase ExeA